MACAAEGQQPSNLFRSPGLQLKHLAVDSMHAADLGVWQDALGSLFFLEIDDKSAAPNRIDGLRRLNGQLSSERLQWRLCLKSVMMSPNA
jgi:hypothetical protein